MKPTQDDEADGGSTRGSEKIEAKNGSAGDAETEAGDGQEEGSGDEDLSPQEIKRIDRSSRLSAPIIYEVLRREGEEEMERPLASLWWSGVAAGLSLSLSILAQGVLRAHLPDAPWRELVVSFGYCLGFLVVVMARHQLFTENTITPVLPLAAEPTLRNAARMARLWSVVLVANFAGTFCAALFFGHLPVVSPEVRGAMLDIAARSMAHPPFDMFMRAVGAGFIIAGMVWLLPSAGPAQPWIVILMTYLVSAAEFSHIIAGSMEAFMLVLDGRLSLGAMLTDFAGPTLAGNIIGGTGLFALISYGQVAQEIS